MKNNSSEMNFLAKNILESNNTAIQMIVDKKIEEALEILKESEKKIEKNNNILTEPKIKVIINHNMACCYQKTKNIQKCIFYLEKVNNEFNSYLEKKHQVSIDINYFINKILLEQIKPEVLYGDFILELRFCAKFHLQMCAAYSQSNNHRDALYHANLAALICEDNIVKTYHLLKQTKKEIENEKNSNNKKYSKIFIEKLQENEPAIISLNEKIMECARNYKSGKNINKKVFNKEDILTFINDKKNKISTRNILGVIKNDDWFNLFNIGNIMFLYAMSYDDLDLDGDPKYELLRDAIIEKILMLTVSFFSIANELRFLGNKADNGLYYHSKTVEISCLYLPSTCPIVKHYVNTYCKYYGNGNLFIDLDKESKIDQEKYDVTKDKILYVENNDAINIIETKNISMDHNYFLNMNNVRNDGLDNKVQFKQAKTDRRNKDSKLSLTVRNPKNININNNKRIAQNNKKNNSRPSTHGPKATKSSLNNINNNINNNNNNNNFTFNNNQMIYKGIDIYQGKLNKNQFKTVQQKDDIFNFNK